MSTKSSENWGKTFAGLLEYIQNLELLKLPEVKALDKDIKIMRPISYVMPDSLRQCDENIQLQNRLLSRKIKQQ